MDAGSIRDAIREAATLGVKEIYFTGGEPFLHPEILPLLLKDAVVVAPPAAPDRYLDSKSRVFQHSASDCVADLAGPLTIVVNAKVVNAKDLVALAGCGAGVGEAWADGPRTAPVYLVMVDPLTFHLSPTPAG